MGRIQERVLCGLLIVVLYTPELVRPQQASVSDICAQQTTSCGACITAHPQCSWCGRIYKNITEPPNMKRCLTYSENLKLCNDTMGGVISYPTGNFSTKVDETVVDNDTVIQMIPQEVTVRLRPGHPVKFNVTFHKLKDYKLDIYYVMDLSYSMNDDLQELQRLGAGLFKDIKSRVTDNVQLGFGSFVDKVMMPFASTVDAMLKNPCYKTDSNDTCTPAFGFRHQLNITSDSSLFEKAINETQISGNIDSPEGSFDALMQIAVCDHIHWRDGSTRVILITTDASPHVAMDGKLAAILEANDMKCHMKWGENDLLPDALVYSKSKLMDYPSLGQLRKVFDDNRIHSIFAVTGEVVELYEKIPQVLNDAFVSELSNDSSNIIPLIAQTYNKLKLRFALFDLKVPSHVKVSYSAFCAGDAAKNGSLQCDNIDEGEKAIFEFELTAMECPSNKGQKDSFLLESSKFLGGVKINLEYICDCDCAIQGGGEREKCNSKGNLTCGVCSCDEGRAGSQCQCDSHLPSGQSVVEACQKDGSDQYCDGNGKCDCGKCTCYDSFKGEHCNCVSTGCPSNNGICGGDDKGECWNCDDGTNITCQCKDGYTLDINKPKNERVCSCHEKLCKETTTSPICSGRGQCECDRCSCNDKNLYSGSYCQTCIHPDCTGIDAQCSGTEVKHCAECLNEKQYLKESAALCDEECGNTFLTYSYVREFHDCSTCGGVSSDMCTQCAEHKDHKFSPRTCTGAHPFTGCSTNYALAWLKSNRYMIYVKKFNKEIDCPKPVNATIIVLSVVGTILVIGLSLLFAWKLFQMQKDRQEYERFQKEVPTTFPGRNKNPLWDPATTTTTNPIHEGNTFEDEEAIGSKIELI